MASITKLPPPPAPLTPAYLHREYAIGVRYERTHDGLLPMDAFWNYERERRSINPARFDFYHPSFGRLLRHEEKANLRHHPIPMPQPLPVSPPVISPPTMAVGVPFTITPPSIPVVPTPAPGGRAVPEPSSGVMLAGAMVLVWLACRVWRRS